MKNMTTEMNPIRFEAAGASTCRNNIASMSTGAIEMKLLPAITSCACGTPAIEFEDAPERETLTLWTNSPAICETMRCPRMPWRSALLQDAEGGAFLEKCVYLALTATAAASLLMAFWQLHSLEAGWASFVELVGRIVS